MQVIANIIHHIDRYGGFTVHVQGTNIFSYAYPSSDHANQARRAPDVAAREMLESEMAALPYAVEVFGYSYVHGQAQRLLKRFES